MDKDSYIQEYSQDTDFPIDHASSNRTKAWCAEIPLVVSVISVAQDMDIIWGWPQRNVTDGWGNESFFPDFLIFTNE